MNTIKLEVKNRKDFLSVDKLTAISSEGEIFNIGDKVKHTGDDENRIGVIDKFSLNTESMDVIAHTEHGSARISFLYR